MHLVVLPAACEGAAVRPLVVTLPIDVVVLELALILGAVGPAESASAILLAEFVFAFEDRAIWPGLLSFAFLLVLDPFTLVFGAVSVVVDAIPMRFVILPVAFVDVAVGVN